MLLLGVITACIWFGVGVFVGWQRSKSAYQIEFAKYETDPGQAKRHAQLRGLAVLLGWAAAGLVGALLWVLLWAFLIIGHAAAEDSSKSKKKGGSSLGSWLLVGGLLLITEETLRSIEENVDDFVIKLALFAIFLGFVAVMFATR